METINDFLQTTPILKETKFGTVKVVLTWERFSLLVETKSLSTDPIWAKTNTGGLNVCKIFRKNYMAKP